MERPEGFGTALKNLSNEIINFGTALKNISDEIIQESDEEKYDTLEEVYARWQSQPATEEQWHEMTQEIQQATAREYEKTNNTPLEAIPEESEQDEDKQISR